MLQRIFLYMLMVVFLQSGLFGMQKHAVVLQYHRFDENRYPTTNIPMKLFTQQIEYLLGNHYTIWPLSKVVRYLMNDQELPDKTVCVTMDDAYKSVYTKAYPLLKKYKLPFTIFINSGPVLHESPYYLSWGEMREMGNFGAEYANHTYSHQYLVRDGIKDPKKYKKHVVKEIEMCENKIEKELNGHVCTYPKMLAYPFGEYDKKLMKTVKELGYIGIAQNSAPISSKSNFMALTRFPMSGDYGKIEQFKLKVNTLPMPLKNLPDEDTLVSESNNPPSLTLTLKKPLKSMQCFTADGKKIIMEWLSDTRVKVQSEQPLQYPRNHYTCTAHAKGNAWYWYSHLWIILEEKTTQ